MPISAPYAIPAVVHAARQVMPRSILDIGVGFGKYGMLFREYLDIWDADREAPFVPGSWSTRLEGVEVFSDYLTPLHDFIYDKIHIGDIVDVIDDLGRYDMIFMADVLEHIDKRQGEHLVRKLYDHADKCVLLTYPREARARGSMFGNESEAHCSVWCRDDFNAYESVGYTVVEDRAEICAIAKPPHEVPFLVGCFAARRRTGWKGRVVSALVHTLGPSRASSMVGRILHRPIALRAE